MNQSGSPLEAAEKLFATLYPEMKEKRDAIEGGKKHLVHYTSAENALNIINGQQFWLRNLKCMNDFMEVQHGIGLLLRTFHAEESLRRDRLYQLCDKIAEGAAKSAVDEFDRWLPSLPHSIYIGCLSEFDPDDHLGRLSMWRAYGSPGGSVALVMNNEPFTAETDVLKAFSVPVLYLSDEEFLKRTDEVLDSLEKNIDSFQNLNAESLQDIIFYWLIFLASSLKHCGFREEQEWRILYVPSLQKSPTIVESVECVRGIPQIVQKIPLEDAPEKGLHGASIAKLIECLVIGPTEYPSVLASAFERALSNRGVADAMKRIRISDIPLR